MAYRNHAAGDDGSIALVNGEFDYASTSGATCGIVIGQEFGLADPYAYGGRPQFRGLSVNDLDSYEATPDYVTG